MSRIIIPETKLNRPSETKRPFEYAAPEIGFRNKIGGAPDGITEEEFPKCPECGRPMSFYGQLDSLNDEVIIADCGLVAVFICFDCLATDSLIVSS